jgi:hypothetical protein
MILTIPSIRAKERIDSSQWLAPALNRTNRFLQRRLQAI